jgi:hypothetical protein
MIAATFLIALGVYLACGLVFAIAFALVGAKRIDPHAAAGTRGFRLLIVPGAMAFWPLLLKRWMSGATHPPEESTAHRIAANPKSEIQNRQSP